MTPLRLLALLSSFLSVALFATAASPDSAAVAAVRRADEARTAAMMAGDAKALAAVFSDQLVFAHSDGRVEGKRDYVAALLAGDTAYVGVRTSEVQTLQPAPDVVVLIGRQDMRKRLGKDWSDITLRFLSVWKQEAGTWRMIAWQSARPPGR